MNRSVSPINIQENLTETNAAAGDATFEAGYNRSRIVNVSDIPEQSQQNEDDDKEEGIDHQIHSQSNNMN